MSPRTSGAGSVIGSDIADFIDHKRALGRKYATEEGDLGRFDRYLISQHVETVDEITPELIDRFLSSHPARRPSGFNNVLGVVRRLFDWMVLQGRIQSSPVKTKPRRRTGGQIPYIFDAQMAARLLEFAAALPDSRNTRFRGRTYHCIFLLMYGLGLRVGEAIRLATKDYDTNRELLTIRNTKFSKTRLVPLGPRLNERLQLYLRHAAETRGALGADEPIFSLRRGQRLHRQSISCVFRDLVAALDIDVPAGTRSPCPHSLRHSFAVGTLLRWYRQGLEPGRRLLHLSTFMGHVQPDSTAVYASYPDGDYCGDTWGAVGQADTLADQVWDDCLAAVTDEVDPGDRDELCTFYLHEVAVAFYDVCVQPKAMPMSQNTRCAGLTSIAVSDPELSAGELRWDEVTQEYWDSFVVGAGGCSGACDIPGVYDIVDSYVFDTPAPYVSREFTDTDGDRFPDTYLTYLHFPAWVTLSMNVDASFVIDVDQGCPGDYDPPNMSRKAAYLERLLDLDYLEYWAYGGTLPPSLVAERARLNDFNQNEPDIHPGSDWEDHRDNVFLLDDAVHGVTIDGGTMEVLLGVEWSFPIHEDREWEWMAQRWANNVIPVEGDLFAGNPSLTTADLTLSVDGVCLYLDQSEGDVQGYGPLGWVLVNTFYNMAEAPCASGSALLGSGLDLGGQMEMSLPVTFFSNGYWDLADGMLVSNPDDDVRLAANRNAMTASLQQMYLEGKVGAMMEPALVTAMTYGGNGGPDYPIVYWPASIIETIKPRRAAVYPRMLVMDELMREGFYTADISNQWSMDELFVSSVSYGYTYDVEPSGHWIGPDIPVNDGHVSWYAFEPEFSAYDNESLSTILGASNGWPQYAGQELYSVLDDADLFGPNYDWMPHDDPLRDADRMPAWCPGRPNDHL